MKILSIDVGIKNLAMCLLDTKTSRIHNWDVSGVPPEHEDGLFVSLRKHLDERPWTIKSDVVLIEKQPDRNRKMKTVENFLHAYFVIKSPNAETIIYDARHKIPDVAGPGRSMYAKRKKTSIERCRAFIHVGDVNADWIDVFDKSKKKDDLADTVMQALSYARRPEAVNTKTTKAKSKVIKPRKPTENQKRTRYSKSNLAYLWKNKLECECLENNKRFMKDLKRYFRDIDDFLKSVDL
jgi:hypothetical protein